MAVANAWAAAGHVLPPSRPSISSSSSTSVSSNLCFSKNLFIKNSKSSRLCCRCVNVNNNSSSSSSSSSSASVSTADENCNSNCSPSDWDWNRWTRYFAEIEQAESFVSVLKFQLEEAIENEDFEEAAKLKAAIAEATAKDSVAEIMSMLKNAVDEERYHDASRLCRSTGSGLVGWWVGYSKESDDPLGRIIRITPGVGRFVGRSYSPRQLVKASPGTPLFEIYVVKDGNTYNLQVVFLQRAKPRASSSSSSSPSLAPKPMKGPSTAEIENRAVIDVKVDDAEAEKSNEKSIDFEGAAEEGIRSVINFLKDKIPDLKVKVMKVNITEEITGDGLKQYLEEEDENAISSEETEETNSDLDDIDPDRVTIGGDGSTSEDKKTLDTKLFIGGVLHNKEDNLVKDDFVRLPAEIKDMAKDSFVLHIPKRPGDHDDEGNTASGVNVAAFEAKDVSELMPPDVAKTFFSSDKEVSKDVKEILKLVISQAQKRNRLSEYTSFSRITTPPGNLDPFEGLYVGAFGPYGTEVVQLRRKYGNWNVNDAEKSTDVEFFEYVEAVKLTGDLNVPAGQVTFRAKIGKGSRLTNRGMYPDELGVVASYRGQGRIAEYGFKNPRWVEGELVQHNGKGMGPHIKGADLGFLYVVPGNSFLVLFSRLTLPE